MKISGVSLPLSFHSLIAAFFGGHLKVISSFPRRGQTRKRGSKVSNNKRRMQNEGKSTFPHKDL